MVRAVNSGVSTLIDPNGRVIEKTYANDPYRHPRGADGVVVSAALLPEADTVFIAVGNLFAYVCLAGTFIILAVALRNRAKATPKR